jgi:hypothetical protein
MNDVINWGALVAALGAIGGILRFWTLYSDRLAAANAKADAAQKAAEEARREAKEAQDKTGILTAQFALYREQAVEKYINRDTLREVEERLTDAIERLGDRFDRAVEKNLHRG